MSSVVRLAVAAVLAAPMGATIAQAQTPLKLHESVAAPQRPLLCSDRESVNLIMPVLARAADARAARDADKSQRLTDIATRLQGEVCRKPAADDVVILRCKLGQVDAGGSSLALVKISALIQSEAAKGEQPFYGWTDLKVDDGVGGPAAQEANTRWCASERATRQIRVEERKGGGNADPQPDPARDIFSASPDIILRVQQRLYDFGLRIDNLDGNLNQETIRNLTQFQKFANLNADGNLTRSTIEKLMTTPAPSPWVTIAFDGFGNFAAETGRTRRDTEMNAIERLQRRSGRDFKLSSVAAPNCLGFAVTRYTERGRRGRTNFTQAFTSAGDSADAAARSAWDYCEREKGGGECQVRYALCADGSGGSHVSDDRERDRDRRRRRDDRQEDTRHDRNSPPVNSPAPKPRFDPDSVSANSPGPAPKFDPGFLPLNSQAPQERPSGPSTQRSDPRNEPVNSPNPNRR